MKTAMAMAITGVLVLASAAWAQSAGQAATIGHIQVKEISVVEIDQTHVKAAVDLTLTAAQSATLNDLRLCSLRLNGQAVFAEPLNQEIVLKKGVATALPPLYVTVLFRDLNTVEPLSRMIATQKVHVDGELVADLHLNLVEKLGLGTLHPKAAISLNQDVPAEVG